MSAIAGVDFSYGCPAIAVWDPKWGEFSFQNSKFFYFYSVKKFNGKRGSNIFGMIPPPFSCDEERFNNICEWAMAILKRFNVKRVCLEGYALGSKTGRVFQIAENTSLLKNAMWKEGISFFCPKPTELKKFYTGKGNAKKEAMGETFIYETGILLHEIVGNATIADKPCNDIIDAYALLKFAKTV